jgi:hypothetical protein
MEFGLYLCVQGHKEHLTNYEYDHVANLPAYLRQVVCLPRSVKPGIMAVYLARSCPECRNYFGVVVAEPEGRGKPQPINDRCAACGYEIHWTLLPGHGSISHR